MIKKWEVAAETSGEFKSKSQLYSEHQNLFSIPKVLGNSLNSPKMPAH